MARGDRPNGPELVDELALVGAKHYVSFASKLARFFIDAEFFPIYDSWAARSVAFVLGHRRIWPRNDAEFFGWMAEGGLCERRRSVEELDQYLWLSGMYREFRRPREPRLGKDILRLFRSPDQRAQGLLGTLEVGARAQAPFSRARPGPLEGSAAETSPPASAKAAAVRAMEAPAAPPRCGMRGHRLRRAITDWRSAA